MDPNSQEKKAERLDKTARLLDIWLDELLELYLTRRDELTSADRRLVRDLVRDAGLGFDVTEGVTRLRDKLQLMDPTGTDDV